MVNQQFAYVFLGGFAILFQFLAAYFGYRIFKYNRLSKPWLALVFAFIIQGIRRLLTLFDDIGRPLLTQSALLDRTLMFIISLLIVIGLYEMMKNFENFEVIKEQTRNKSMKINKTK